MAPKEEKKKKQQIEIKGFEDSLSSESKHVYPFNCSPLDILLGGGLYSGKIYEFFGKPSSAKSTLSLECAKAFIDYNKSNNVKFKVLWVESESAYDKIRAKYMGIDQSCFSFLEAPTVEDGFEGISYFLENLETDCRSLIVWDTIAAVPTRNEKDTNDMFSGGIGEKARLISKALRKITMPLSDTDSTMIFVNQLRENIGGMGYGDNDSTPGGQAIKFHSSTRLKMTQIRKIPGLLPNGEERTVGIISEAFSVKNKLSLPFQKCQMYIYGETGLDKIETTIMYLKNNDLIDVAGAGWATIKNIPKVVAELESGEIKFQSLDKFKKGPLTDFPKLKDYLDYLVYLENAKISPLLKIRIIDKIWKYEVEFYGSKKTKITNEEYEAAKLIYKDLEKNED